MQTVYLKINEGKPGIKKITLSLVKWLKSKGVKVLLDCSAAKTAGRKAVKIDLSMIDLFIALGGDGTLLSLVRQARPTKAPFIGINAGMLGFLTEIKLKDMKSALNKVLKGEYEIDERSTLETEIEDLNGKVKTLHSLNDTVISALKGRLITLDVHVNEEYLNSYRADGIIISTPTGSTAYSLSAGGPIVSPKLNGIIITPICPHMLSNRPIIVPDDSVLKIFVKVKGGNKVKVTADGQSECLIAKDSPIIIRKAKTPVKLVVPAKNSFYEILRQKLNWR
ncbi:MAG: NAD(+)/NADH kinase [Candidatus Firestonebacteria bacterium]|nr:NAD(+)/NADH kinase [Candidatus Firestonebacteria bacterium]